MSPGSYVHLDSWTELPVGQEALVFTSDFWQEHKARPAQQWRVLMRRLGRDNPECRALRLAAEMVQDGVPAWASAMTEAFPLWDTLGMGVWPRGELKFLENYPECTMDADKLVDWIGAMENGKLSALDIPGTDLRLKADSVLETALSRATRLRSLCLCGASLKSETMVGIRDRLTILGPEIVTRCSGLQTLDLRWNQIGRGSGGVGA